MRWTDTGKKRRELASNKKRPVEVSLNGSFWVTPERQSACICDRLANVDGAGLNDATLAGHSSARIDDGSRHRGRSNFHSRNGVGSTSACGLASASWLFAAAGGLAAVALATALRLAAAIAAVAALLATEQLRKQSAAAGLFLATSGIASVVAARLLASASWVTSRLTSASRSFASASRLAA